MRKLYGVIKALTVLVIVLSPLTLAQGEEIGETIGKIKVNTIESMKIKNGINHIDLNGDGKKDMVISGYRGNISAHSFSVYSFYVYKKLGLGEISYEWQIVSIGGGGGFAGDDIRKYVIATHQGADCVLRDIRLARFKKDASYYLVIADRPLGQSYGDSLNVKFLFYRLIYDEDEMRYIYEKVKEINSKDKYCDVNEAFENELGY
jgi:hypothetical protein